MMKREEILRRAKRLIQSQARAYVYENVLKADPQHSFSQIQELESSILEEAQLDWARLLVEWPPTTPTRQAALQVGIKLAVEDAWVTTQYHFKELGAEPLGHVNQFFKTFTPEPLLKVELPS